MNELDTAIHQPTRLRIMMVLSGVETADFNFLLNTLSLTKGNLSSHISHLEDARYVQVTKAFEGKIPHTSYRITGWASLAWTRTGGHLTRYGRPPACNRLPGLRGVGRMPLPLRAKKPWMPTTRSSMRTRAKQRSEHRCRNEITMKYWVWTGMQPMMR